MGGFGSGRPSGSGRSTVGQHRAVDANTLQREGCLRLGWTGSWQWTGENGKTNWIGIKAGAGSVRLSYNVRLAGGAWQDVEEDVRVTHVPCRFGGSRAYLLCPGVVNGIACRRRVVKLYGADRFFLCRHCYRLAYASQGEDDLDRMRRRARKVRNRLGGSDNMLVPFPPKPKGMWTRTYDRLRTKALAAEFHADMLFEDKAAGLLARVEGLNKRSFW